MEHARKMMLVDAGSSDLRNMRRHHSELDQDVSGVLNRQDISDDEKLKLYQTTLNKFLISRQTVEKKLTEPVKVETVKSSSGSADQDDKTTELGQILSELLNRIKKEGESSSSSQTPPTPPLPISSQSPSPFRKPQPPTRGRETLPKRSDRPRRAKRFSTSWVTYQ